MTAFNKVNLFTRDVLSAKHDFSSHVFKFMLTNTLPVVANAIKSDITEIGAGNGYTAGGTASSITLSNASGVEKVVAAAVTFTATGAVGPFQYCVLYNDSQGTPVKPLVGWYDYGSAVTLANTQTFTITPDQTNGFCTLT